MARHTCPFPIILQSPCLCLYLFKNLKNNLSVRSRSEPKAVSCLFLYSEKILYFFRIASCGGERFVVEYRQWETVFPESTRIYYIIRMDLKMKAVITVTGKDTVGNIAKVSAECADCSANILDITQTVLGDYFVMIMLVNIDELKMDFNAFVDRLADLGKKTGLVIHAMHEDIFNTMHRI